MTQSNLTPGGWASPPAQNTSSDDLALLSWGSVSPLGATTTEAALAYRAGSSALVESSALTPDSEPCVMALFPLLDPYAPALDRKNALLLGALDEAFQKLPQLMGRNTKVFLLLDEEQVSTEKDGAQPSGEVLSLSARDWVRTRLGTMAQTEVDQTGAAGLGALLKRASDELAKGTIEFAVVCATHSDHDPQRLAFLHENQRIHAADTLDGILLGEGATALLMANPYGARQLGVQPILTFSPPPVAFESATVANDHSAFEAAGLTVAARRALEPVVAGGQKVGWILSDASFEMFRMQELQVVLTRLQRHLCPPQILDMPCQRIGNLGATTGLWQIAYTAEAWSLGFGPCPRNLCLLGSDSGIRTALLLEKSA